MRHLIAIITGTLFILATSLAMAGGDAANGKALTLDKGCAGCHGVDGNSAMAQDCWSGRKISDQATQGVS